MTLVAAISKSSSLGAKLRAFFLLLNTMAFHLDLRRMDVGSPRLLFTDSAHEQCNIVKVSQLRRIVGGNINMQWGRSGLVCRTGLCRFDLNCGTDVERFGMQKQFMS